MPIVFHNATVEGKTGIIVVDILALRTVRRRPAREDRGSPDDRPEGMAANVRKRRAKLHSRQQHVQRSAPR